MMYFGHGRRRVENFFAGQKILVVNVVVPIAEESTCFSYKDVRHRIIGSDHGVLAINYHNLLHVQICHMYKKTIQRLIMTITVHFLK